jgi:hypothetical protein
MGGVFRPKNKPGQDEKRQVYADVDAEQAAYRDGPASHNRLLLLFYMDGYIEGGIQKYMPCE